MFLLHFREVFLEHAIALKISLLDSFPSLAEVLSAKTVFILHRSYPLLIGKSDFKSLSNREYRPSHQLSHVD